MLSVCYIRCIRRLKHESFNIQMNDENNYSYNITFMRRPFY